MQTEQQLKVSLREIDDLTSALDEPAIVAVTDPQGRITRVNDKFCAISRFSREELLGQDHRIINSGYHSREFFRDLTLPALRTGKIANHMQGAHDGAEALDFLFCEGASAGRTLMNGPKVT